MNVLMFGWEFPPLVSGGLGTACYGLTKELSNEGISITFVMPNAPTDLQSHVKIRSASCPKCTATKSITISTTLRPYMSATSYSESWNTTAFKHKMESLYGKNLYDEVHRYAREAGSIAREEDFDVIHAHDWLTYKAGIHAKLVSGKPLVVHVHATEFDRTGGHCNQYVYDIEREGMHVADHIIAVSNYTKNTICSHYGIPGDKVTVVHNGVECSHDHSYYDNPFHNKKVVLFLGRLTMQKGPEYFLHAAARVSNIDPDAVFVVAGDGDKMQSAMELSSRLGISDKVFFSGFLTGNDINRAYRMAHVYVMPSVSEPFGITALEAASNGTPVIVSKQSGVSEVMKHSLKADFWDVDKMASYIGSILRYPPLKSMLGANGQQEVASIDWRSASKKTISVYNKLVGYRAGVSV
jgi:glycogen synthase